MDIMEDVLDSLSKAILKNIKELSKINDLDQKKTQAETVKLLCESMGVFLRAVPPGGPDFTDDYDDDDDDDYDEDEDMPF